MSRYAVLGGLVALIAALRLHTFAEPVERDLTTYAVIAHEMLGGRALYSDLWDHKPPAIHLTYAAAELATGYGHGSLYLLAVVAAAIAMLGVYALTATIAGNTTTGLVAAGLFAVVCGDLDLQANQPNTEVFINALSAWAVALLARDDGPSRRTTVAAGLLFAAASLYKTNAVTIAAAAAIALVATAAGTLGRRQALRQVGALMAIGLLAWAGVTGYFAATGRLAPFRDAVFVYNQAYAGDALYNLARGLQPKRLLPLLAPTLLPVVALVFVGLVATARRASQRGPALLLAYGAGAYAATALPGHFYPHYYQLWLPALTALAGIGLHGVARRILRPWAETVAGIVVVGLLLALQAPSYRLSPDDWSRRKYGEMFVESRATGLALDRVLPPGASFYEWGSETGLYFWSRRSPPAGVFYALPLTSGPLAEPLSRRVLADLERRPPELMLFELRTPQDPANPVIAWARAHYRPTRLAGGADRFDYWVRRGGTLDAQLPR